MNPRLPEAERYRRDVDEPGKGPEAPLPLTLPMTPAQLDLIGRVLGDEIAGLRARLDDPSRAHSLRALTRAILRRLARRLRGG